MTVMYGHRGVPTFGGITQSLYRSSFGALRGSLEVKSAEIRRFSLITAV